MKLLIIDEGMNTIIMDSNDLYVVAYPHSYDGMERLSDMINTKPQYGLTGNETRAELNEQVDLFLKKTDEPVDVICYGELVTFDNRTVALKFYENCFYGTEGAESERYSNIVYDLKHTNKSVVSDEDEMMIRRIGRFTGTHCEEIKDLGKWVSYNEYKN